MRGRKTRARHDQGVNINGRATPGLCIKCGEMVSHLYLNPYTGTSSCYPCKKKETVKA